MAKSGSYEHYKTQDLAHELGIPQAYAFGLMCSMWNFASIYAKDGNIGKFEPDSFARRIGFAGNAVDLINALIKVKLLDDDEEDVFYLYVHDWHLHCEDSVNMALAKSTLRFANGDMPTLSKFNKDEQERIKEQYSIKDAQHCAEMRTNAHLPLPMPLPIPIPDKTLGGFCNKTPPPQTDDNPSKSSEKPTKYKPDELEELWKELLDCYPSRGKADRCVAKGKQAYLRLLRDGEEPQTILLGTQGYAAAVRALGNDGTSYVKQLTTYFNNRTWEEYLGTTPTNGKPKPPHLSALQMADGCSYVWSEEKWKLYTPVDNFEVDQK